MPTALPTAPAPLDVFDVFYILPGTGAGKMSEFLTYTDVEVVEDTGDHFDTDGGTGDFVATSGGTAVSAETARIIISTAVPDLFTSQHTITINKLPVDFLDVTGKHLYYGVSDQQGATFGLFFSKVGIAYTGSVAYDSSGNLKLNSPFQVLPNSTNVVEEGKQYTIRVVVDSVTLTTYVYVTPAGLVATSGHKLRYVLPAFVSTNSLVTPSDSTFFSLSGTRSEPTSFSLHAVGLSGLSPSNGLLIPNLPPVAQTNADQTVRACSIVRFDGSASFDPEGTPLSYKWRLIDAPETSAYAATAHDGSTTGGVLTDKVYTTELWTAVMDDPVAVGDVLLFNGQPYDISFIQLGSYIQISSAALPVGLVQQGFHIIRNRGISGPTTAKPTFFPDVQGIFRFDLTVFDGELYSTAENTVVNVVDSPIPRGITPDVSFLWSYLSDFWRLVDNTEVIETFWESLAQIAASELLTLWQHDYSKSLRDIQRTFQRRWLHYDTFIREPAPNVTTVGTVFSGVIHAMSATPATAPSGGFIATIQSPMFPDLHVNVVNHGTLTVASAAAQLLRQLEIVDKRFTVSTHLSADSTTYLLVVQYPFPFRMTGSDQSGSNPFEYTNAEPKGTGGYHVGTNTYYTGRKLDVSTVVPGDFLVVDGIAYKIAKLTSATADQWSGMRVVTQDPLPQTMGKSWHISRGTRSSFLDFYQALCTLGDTATYEVVEKATGVVAFVSAEVLAASPDGTSVLLVDTEPLLRYLSQPSLFSVLFFSVYRRTYLPLDPLVVSIPLLQEKIKGPTDASVLRLNIDYFIETYRGRNCLRFSTSSSVDADVWEGLIPPQRLWAEITYINNVPVIEQNFGVPASFTQYDLSKLSSNADYLSIVRSLWYTYFTGPTLHNLRVGTQVLLGLPFAEEDGIITEIRGDFSEKQGRVLAYDVATPEITRSYYYPNTVELDINPSTGKQYVVGDTLQQFDPLVTGVEVVDYVKDPEWYKSYIGQGAVYEVEKFFKFLVRIDSSVFSLPTLALASSFVKRIKPTYTYPLLVVRKVLDQGTTVDVSDDSTHHTRLNINEWPGVFDRDAHWPAYVDGAGDTPGPYGDFGHLGGAYDDARPAFGGWRGKYDGDYYQGTPTPGPKPISPDANVPVHWGYDRQYLVPEDAIVCRVNVHCGPAAPVEEVEPYSVDHVIFKTLFTAHSGTLSCLPSLTSPHPHTDPALLGGIQLASASGFPTHGVLQFKTNTLTGPCSIGIDFYVNGTFIEQQFVTVSLGTYTKYATFPSTLTLNAGDKVEVYLSSRTTTEIPIPGGAQFLVALGDGLVWVDAGTVPEDIYVMARLM